MNETAVSVVASSRNAARYAERWLFSIRRWFPDSPVIVADDRSTDGTHELLASLGVDVVDAACTSGAGRNIAIDRVDTPFALVVDVDNAYDFADVLDYTDVQHPTIAEEWRLRVFEDSRQGNVWCAFGPTALFRMHPFRDMGGADLLPEDAWFFLDDAVEIVPVRRLGTDLKRPRPLRVPIVFYNRRRYAGLTRSDVLRITFKFLRYRAGWWHATTKLAQLGIDALTFGYSGGRNETGERLE